MDCSVEDEGDKGCWWRGLLTRVQLQLLGANHAIAMGRKQSHRWHQLESGEETGIWIDI